MKELLGNMTDRDPFVYLSDGGHFDNLGAYELFRRRCHVVIISDASLGALVAWQRSEV